MSKIFAWLDRGLAWLQFIVGVVLDVILRPFLGKRKRRKKPAEGDRINYARLALVGIVLVCTIGYGYYSSSSNKVVAPVEPPPPPPTDNLKREERLSLKKNIMVMGVDERSDDNGRSDTLFVVIFDTDKNSVELVSVPRDTLAAIPRYGWDKINHAYAYGGHKTTQAAVEELLGIQVSNYVKINFRGFKGIIDAIGGVDIDVEKDMYYEDPWDGESGLVIDLKKGMQHLDGENAICYVRYRDSEGDIGRIKRQQKFIKAVYEKILSQNLIVTMPGLLKQVLGMLDTDLTLVELGQLGKAAYTQMKEIGLHATMVPGIDVMLGDLSFWKPDMTKLRTMMATMQGATMTDKYAQAADTYEAEMYSAMERLKKLRIDEDGNIVTEEELKKSGKKPAKKGTVEPKVKGAKSTSGADATTAGSSSTVTQQNAVPKPKVKHNATERRKALEQKRKAAQEAKQSTQAQSTSSQNTQTQSAPEQAPHTVPKPKVVNPSK